METEFATITCPACMQRIDIPAPHWSELPAELDYDCEVCCRPMLVRFSEEMGAIVAEARGQGE